MLALLVVVLAAVVAAVQGDAAASNAAATVATPARTFSGDVAMQCVGECHRRRRVLQQTALDGDLVARRPGGGQHLDDDGAQANTTLGGIDDPAHDKQVLPDSAARMTEDLEEDEEGAVQEGRAAKRGPSLKIRKVDGHVLQMLLMLKMMPVMFISTKVAILSFLVQLKSLMLSLVTAGIAAVQFFWRFQEKRQRAGLQSAAASAHAANLAAAQASWATEEHGLWPDRRKYISY